MRHTFQNAFALLKEHPLRGFLSLLAMLAGAFLLSSAWGVSDGIVRLAGFANTTQGTVVSLANGTIASDGSFSRAQPAVFDASVAAIVKGALPGATDASPVINVPFTRYTTEKGAFRVRDVLGVAPSYLDTMELKLLAGQNLSADDVQNRRAVALISADTAAILFGGNPQDAVGKTMETVMFGRFQATTRTAGSASSGSSSPGASSSGSAAPSAPVPVDIPRQTFTVKGVYAAPSETERTALGIGDALLPYTAAMPGNFQIPISYFWGTTVFSVKGVSFDSAKVAVSSAITAQKRDKWQAVLWQGDPTRPSFAVQNTAQQLNSLVYMINILGIVLIFVSGVGMYGIMTVEVAGRSKHYGIRRALGTSSVRIVGLVVEQAASLASLGALPGVLIAMLFNGAIIAGFKPWYQLVGLNADLSGALALNPLPYLLAFASVTAAAGLFGLLPALRILKTSPVNLLREEGV